MAPRRKKVPEAPPPAPPATKNEEQFAQEKPAKEVKYYTATCFEMRNPFTGDWFRRGEVTPLEVVDSWTQGQIDAGLVVERKM